MTHVSLDSLLEVLDKGKAASVAIIIQTKDKATGKVIFENQSTLFIRGSGGFGGKRTGKGTVKFELEFRRMAQTNGDHLLSDRGPATAANVPPKRNPDVVVEEKTLPSQAALYR